MRFIVLLTALVVALPLPAHAFNLGFVRVPDWMDKWFLVLVPVTVIFWLLTLVSKPSGVPFNKLYRRPLTGFNRACYNGLLMVFIVTMAMLFLGMGLRRAVE
ncbi:MAG: hypothetical protein AAF479_13950 [Pseudomonadota bacterium]